MILFDGVHFSPRNVGTIDSMHRSFIHLRKGLNMLVLTHIYRCNI